MILIWRMDCDSVPQKEKKLSVGGSYENQGNDNRYDGTVRDTPYIARQFGDKDLQDLGTR